MQADVSNLRRAGADGEVTLRGGGKSSSGGQCRGRGQLGCSRRSGGRCDMCRARRRGSQRAARTADCRPGKGCSQARHRKTPVQQQQRRSGALSSASGVGTRRNLSPIGAHEFLERGPPCGVSLRRDYGYRSANHDVERSMMPADWPLRRRCRPMVKADVICWQIVAKNNQVLFVRITERDSDAKIPPWWEPL